MSSDCLSFTRTLDGQCLVDKTALNKARLSSSVSTTNADGSFNINKIDQLGADFISSYLEEAEENPITKAVNFYGQEIYTSLNNANQIFKQTNLAGFPTLNDRITRGQIGILEFSDFLGEYNYNLSVFDATLANNIDKINFEFDAYYQNTFSSSILGGFCRTIQNVFGAIDAFFDLVDMIQGFISDAISFINKFKSGQLFSDAAKKASAEALIRTMKEKIKDIICQAWLRTKNAILNLNVVNLINDTDSHVNPQVAKKGKQIRQRSLALLSEDNCERMTEKVEALLDYAVSIFELPSLEEIQYLILRFCALLSNVEALIYDIRKPTQNFALKYQNVVNRLRRVSDVATGKAIINGGKRYDRQLRKQKADEAWPNWSKGIDDALNGVEQDTNLPTPSGKPPKNRPPKRAFEYEKIPDWETVSSGGSSVFTFYNKGKNFGDGQASWYNMEEEFIIDIMNIQAVIGKPFQINSAWRSTQYNKRVGGVEGSFHTSGMAFDIATKNLNSNDIQLIRDLVKLYDYEVIGGYRNHIHIEPAPHWQGFV